MPEFARARWFATGLALCLTAWVVTYETGSLIGAAVGKFGAFPATTIYGPTQLIGYVFQHGASPAQAFSAWASAAQTGIEIRTWLVFLMVTDFVFILGYGGALWSAALRWNLPIRRYLPVLLGADIVEDVVTLVAARTLPHISCPTSSATHAPVCPPPTTYVPPQHLWLLSTATAVKWGATVVIAATIGYTVWSRARLRRRFAGLRAALARQRFLLIIVAVLSVLLVVPGPPILAQGVDVERSWVLNDDLGSGLRSLALGIAFMGLLSATLRYLSSVHSAPEPPEPEEPAFSLRSFLTSDGPWLLAVAVIAGGAELLQHTHRAEIYWKPLSIVLVVLGAVPALSVLLVKVSARKPPDAVSDEQRRMNWKVGRLLSWSVLILLGVSVARAYVSPMLLGYQTVLSAVLLALGVLLASGLTFLVLSINTEPKLLGDNDFTTKGAIFHPQRVGARQSTTSSKVPNRPVSILESALLALVAVLALLLLPLTVARVVGLVGVFGLCLAALTLVFTTLSVASQLIDPPHVFRLFGARRTPVIGLVVLMGLLTTFLSPGTPLHAIRGAGEGADGFRPTIRTAAQTWFDEPPACTIATQAVIPPGDGHAGSRPVQLRPMLFVAAEGGGIRAEWWTVDAVTALSTPTCGKQSIFLTSGVSGGATGLALMAGSPRTAYSDMKKVAGPDAASAAVEGMLSRDLVAGTFGINLRALDAPADDRYPDRADLLEQTWEHQAPVLRHAFPVPTPREATWYSIFNGTSVDHSCRVLVSDVAFDPAAKECDSSTISNSAPGTYDLFAAQGCHLGMRLSTAGLLAARFPFVTPSGVISECGRTDFAVADQIIDGGYSENSGIDTLNSALTQLMPLIRAQNLSAVQAIGDGPVTFVVPMVVFLHNTVDTSAPLAKAAKASPEVAIPPLGALDAKFNARTSTLLARASAITASWAPAGAGLSPADQTSIDVAYPRTMTVAPQQEPQMALPLGWAFSNATEKSLDRALNNYLGCMRTLTNPSCAPARAFDQLAKQLGVADTFQPS